MDHHIETLANGLRLLTIPMPSVASLTVMIMVGAGSRYEEREINGLSHFLEHMAFKGTQKRPTALAISSIIDGIGGEFNAFTTKDHTGYYIKAACKHFPTVVDVLSDMLLHSKFDPVEVEKERGVIIEEINMYEDTPMKKVGDLFENLLYGDTKLGRDISGRKEVIRKIKREDFLKYIDKLYCASNTVIAVAGGINGVTKPGLKIADIIEKYLGSWNGRKKVAIEKIDDRQDKPGLLVRYRDTQQAHLCLGFRSYHLDHPDRFKLSVLTNILGGSMSSRLFIQVRERRGLAYYVRSNTEEYEDVGNFVTQAGVDVARIEDAIKVMLEEFAKITKEKVTHEELVKAKENIKGRFTLELEDSKNVAAFFGSEALLEKEILTPEKIMRRIDEVTEEDVQVVAQDIFRQETLNLAIIGPYKKDERFRKILSLK